MKDYLVSDIKKEVRLTLDQNSTGGSLLTLTPPDIDALMLDSIIESKLLDAARIVETNAPVHTLGGGKSYSVTSITWNEDIDGSGSFALPEDYLRLVVFKMKQWQRPVSSVISISDPLYSLQKSKFSGVRGCPEKPIVALVPASSGQKMEFYCSHDSEDSVELCQYVPMPSIDASNKVSICERLKSAIVYYTAYLVALSVGENELANALQNTANDLMQ